MKTCTQCGSPNDETLSRCARCGAKLPHGPADQRQPTGDVATKRPENHMSLAVLAALLFVPFGLWALVHAAQIRGQYAAGERDRARRAAQRAKRWAHAGIVTGLIVDTLLVLAARLA